MGFSSSNELVVTIRKDVILTRLKANRDFHVERHKQALAGFMAKVRQLSEDLVAATPRDNGPPDDSKVWSLLRELTRLDKPVTHYHDYGLAIEMFTLSTKDELHLPSSDFRKYMWDEWEWKSEFEAVTSSYLEE